jgi:light-regulated signal transduction histidine kinase (bacteriophytochrome)
MCPGMSPLTRGLAAVAALAARAFPQDATNGSPTPADQLSLIESVAGTLRDGLSTIKGFSELLAHGESADAASASRFILESSEDLNRFLANLQEFVRHEQGRLCLLEQQVDAAELVESALSACRGTAERADITILARLIEGVELNCDPPRIRNAIANMVLWAAGMAIPGSAIVLRLLCLPDGGIAIAVTGMVAAPPPDALFEPRPDADGLLSFSLPVARRVALLHSGDLTADHGAGGVMTLCLMLPPDRVISPQRSDACERCAA